MCRQLGLHEVHFIYRSIDTLNVIRIVVNVTSIQHVHYIVLILDIAFRDTFCCIRCAIVCVEFVVHAFVWFGRMCVHAIFLLIW
jgi:hypothetical protein